MILSSALYSLSKTQPKANQTLLTDQTIQTMKKTITLLRHWQDNNLKDVSAHPKDGLLSQIHLLPFQMLLDYLDEVTIDFSAFFKIYKGAEIILDDERQSKMVSFNNKVKNLKLCISQSEIPSIPVMDILNRIFKGNPDLISFINDNSIVIRNRKTKEIKFLPLRCDCGKYFSRNNYKITRSDIIIPSIDTERNDDDYEGVAGICIFCHKVSCHVGCNELIKCTECPETSEVICYACNDEQLEKFKDGKDKSEFKNNSGYPIPLHAEDTGLMTCCFHLGLKPHTPFRWSNTQGKWINPKDGDVDSDNDGDESSSSQSQKKPKTLN
jgi:hypothetical protein